MLSKSYKYLLNNFADFNNIDICPLFVLKLLALIALLTFILT